MTTEKKVWSIAELSGEECAALAYAQFKAGMNQKDFLKAVATAKEKGMTNSDFRQAIHKGLKKLHEKGIVTLEKDGHAELVPTQINFTRVKPTSVILGDHT